jgi:hypothetical protein
MNKKDKIELVNWETIRSDCKYPQEDNNDGYIFGIAYIDFDGESDILDYEWFKTEKDRCDYINENNLEIL